MKQNCVYLFILFFTLSKICETENKNSHDKPSKKSMKDMTKVKHFKQEEITPTKTEKIECNHDLQKNEKMKIEISDWLKISSQNFKNKHKFPPLRLPDGSYTKIIFDEEYFRINYFYDPMLKNGPPSNTHFWFRLTGRNLYYAINKEDLNILDSISIKEIKDIKQSKGNSNDPLCFKIVDEEMQDWKLCATSFVSKLNWICKIKDKLGPLDPDCKKLISEDPEITILTNNLIQPIFLIPQPARICNQNWDYSRHGDNWECQCAEGKEQSPIDLPLPKSAIKSEARPLFQYEEVLTTNTEIQDNNSITKNLKIKYVNSVLKISSKNFGKVVTLDGSIYSAEDIIFHTPSEHTINEKKYDMEMQIIHYGQTKGDTAKQVILSFLFEKKPGIHNKFIDDIDFFNLPNPSLLERDIENNLYIPKIFYSSDSDDLPIMKNFSFYTYHGSLTQPPCNESTVVYVASKPIQLGISALTLFQESARITDLDDSNLNTNNAGPSNNRNTKSLNDRKIYHYDHTEIYGPDSYEKTEKVKKMHTEYFYVNGEKPSELTAAFVVSESEGKVLVNVK